MNTRRPAAVGRLARFSGPVPASVILAITFGANPGSAATREHRLRDEVRLAAVFSPEPEVRAPEFPKGVTWLNSPPLTLKQLRGKVVLVDFWEYTCVNCIRTFPYLKEWDRRYRDKGLVIIGVHTPEFAFAKQVENVRRAAAGFGFKYPLVVDSDYKVWNAFDNHYWPAKYLIDRNGVIRYSHFGEGNYGNTEEQIQALLKQIHPKATFPPVMEALRPEDRIGAVCYPVTPELYAGSARGELGSRPAASGESVYQDPGSHEDGVIYPHGAWAQSSECLLHTRQTSTPQDYVALKYHALGLNAVLKPERGKPIRLDLEQDGQPVAKEDAGADLRYDAAGRSYVLVDQPRMYNLVKNAKFGRRELKLLAADEGLGLYSFTFTSCEAGAS